MNINKHSEAIQFGYGVFETMLFRNGYIVSFDAHMNRLQSSLSYLNMTPISKEYIVTLINKETENIDLTCYVIKLTCLLDESITKVVVTTREMPYHKKDYDDGYRLTISKSYRHSKNLMFKHKTTSIISSKLEMGHIKNLGYQESIHLNENNHITEGIYSNIFFVKQGCLHTPNLDCGVLPGITRNRVIDLSKKLGVPIKIGYYGIKDLTASDEVFLTSSVLGLMPVASFEEKTYDLENNRVTKLLNKEMLL